MTRQAARTGFETFVDDAITITAEEFSVSRALRQGVRGPGGKVVDRLLKDSDALWARVVRPELDAYRDQILTQFDVVLDYVTDDAGIDAYRDEILANDSYAAALQETIGRDRRDRIHADLVTRQQRLGDAVEPLVSAPENNFWDALEATFEHDRAVSLVEDHFAFTGPLRAERNAYRMATTFDPADVLGGFGSLLGGLPTVEVEYTDEAIRSMRRAEQTVIVETKREITRQLA